MQNKVQLDAALAYLSQRSAAPLDPAALNEAAGVGVVVRAASLRASPCRASGARRCMHAACALKTITAAQWESSLVYHAVGTGVPSRGVRRCPRGGRGKRGPAACREVLSSQHWGSASCYAVLLCLGFHELHSCYGAAWVSTTLLMLLCRSVDTLLQAWMRPARWPVLPEGVLACPHSAFHLYQSCVVA